MGNILVIAEVQNGKIREVSFELANFAQQLAKGGRTVHSLLVGHQVEPLAESLVKGGGGEVHVADHELLANYSLDAFLKAARAAVEAVDASIVLVPNTPTGWDLAPVLAATIDAAFVSDCFKIEDTGGTLAFTRRIFNGKLDARLTTDAERVVLTVQPGATKPFEGGSDGKVSKLDVALSAGEMRTRFIEKRTQEAKGVDLTKADIIVSGGRGVGAPEKFPEVIQPLADALGGAMGASRPVVDAGWLPHEYQIGSSGQVVSPKLYIAAGISGAIQHLVGMKTSNFIVAINKDADAPIFEVADLGVVGDLFEIVPALTKAVQAAKGG